MKNTSLEKQVTELKSVLMSYLEARLDLGKAVLLEKMSKIGTFFLTIMSFVIVIASFLLLLAFAFSYWYGNTHGSVHVGFLISAGFYVLVGIILFVFRKPLFSNSIIQNLGKVLFDKESEGEL
ncbi:MAG: hypothetical protein KQH79_15300 [Bacteroidetes bacterium]|nr:hypothetical protein [Bacteroidota bacterium]